MVGDGIQAARCNRAFVIDVFGGAVEAKVGAVMQERVLEEGV
jgi:hypothetical protein